MNPTESMSYISIAVIAISLFFIGTELTGLALVSTGDVNVTIDTSASINFSTALLDFGNGTVTPGQTAIMNSNGTSNAHWTGTTSGMTGLILENNGNVNVTVSLKTNDEADAFIGGTTPSFKIRVTNNGTETGSCNTIGNFSTYEEVTTGDQLACGGATGLGSDPTEDSIRIDAELTINSDTQGAKTTFITATAVSVP